MIDKKEAQKKGLEIVDTSKVRDAFLENLKANFPQTIKEGRADLKTIATLLGLNDEKAPQAYGLNFIGKGLAHELYSTPTQKCLKVQEHFHPEPSTATPSNFIIRGDNLDALKILKAAYTEKIKMIYIDPPYNTKNENFIYPDNFREDYQELLRTLGLVEIDDEGREVESEALKFISNIQATRTHSGWLAFMLPRLKLARDLLRKDGVIFISIDDNEQANLKILCDEIFGEENFCGQIIWLKGNAQNDADTIQTNHEYILCYAKNIESKPIYKIKQKVKAKAFKDEKTGKFYYEGAGLTMGGGDGGSLENRPNLGYTFYYNPKTKDIKPLLDYDKNAVTTTTNHEELYNDDEELIKQGYTPIRPPKMGAGNGRWKWALEKTLKELDRILIKKGKNGYSVSRKEWLSPKQVKEDDEGELYAMVEKENPPKSFIDFVSSGRGIKELKDLLGNKAFNNPKNTLLLKHLLKISTTPTLEGEGDIVLDFFAGSGTTAQAVMELNAEDGGNRKFILVQIDEPILESKNKAAYDFCKNTLKSPVPLISDITIERVKRAASKIKAAPAFSVLSLEDKPKLITTKKDELTLTNKTPLAPRDKALNLALHNGKFLHQELEEIFSDRLYKCEDCFYLIACDEEVLAFLRKEQGKEIHIDGYGEFKLDDFLNLKTNHSLKVIY